MKLHSRVTHEDLLGFFRILRLEIVGLQPRLYLTYHITLNRPLCYYKQSSTMTQVS